MPTEYKRKGSTKRGEWTIEQLSAAVAAIDRGDMGIREAGREFGISEGTLRRRRKSRDLQTKKLGPSSTLGTENEAKIVAHIKKLQKHGFAPTRTSVRSMAFELAETLTISHKFNKESRKAGYPWLDSFLRRNKELSIRKSEGVSAARSLAMTKENVASYFSLLERTLIENELMSEPGCIFNMDETGLQLNNRPEHVVAIKGSKNVASVTSSEKGETISVIVCCNGEGVYIPPTCIFKGKNKKPEYQDGMPPGSTVYMSKKSAYVNSEIFFTWLKEQFVPRKPAGKVLLLLDGHSSHCSNIEMLEYASQNGVILFCLPSHSTQFLQPLDRGFFRSLKGFYYEACDLFLRANPGRRITRLQFGKLLSTAWEKSATIKNAVSSFKATGIIPFDPSIIPDYAYLTEEASQAELQCRQNSLSNIIMNKTSDDPTVRSRSISPQPSCSTEKKRTPGKLLDQISPVPVARAVQTTRKRSKQLAAILSSYEHISEKKKKQEKKGKQAKPSKDVERKSRAGKHIEKKKQERIYESSDDAEDESEIIYDDSSTYEDESDLCVGCREEYSKTKKTEDWIQCIICQRWLHEGCTKFKDFCDFCGKKKTDHKNK